MSFSHATILLKSIFFVFCSVATMLAKVGEIVQVASLLVGQLIFIECCYQVNFDCYELTNITISILIQI